MKNIIRNFIKEPLVHFLLLGGLIYFFYSLNAVKQTISPQQQKQQISLDKSEINELKRNYEHKFHQTADKKMLSSLYKNAIKKKILLQEAYKLELYKNDKNIEKILLKKMHFIINAAASQTQPDETQLKDYYTKNIKDYAKRENISFCIIHFESLSNNAQKDFYQLLRQSNDFTACKQENNQTKKQLIQKYGNYFANKIFQAKKGAWLPAVHSKNGLEFVYISDYKTQTPYPFEEIEERVLRDYQTQYKSEKRKKVLQQMQSAYSINVDK